MALGPVALLLFCAACGGPTEADSVQAGTAPDSAAVAAGFADVTAAAGLGDFRHETGAFGKIWFPETMGSGGGFVDVNGDGWLDIVLVGGGVWEGSTRPAPPALRLYINNGAPGSSPGQGPTFTEQTEAAGLAELTAYGMGITAADYDNDGDEDLFLTTVGSNLLLRNDGARSAGGVPRFTEVGERAGLAGEEAWSTAAVFFDADRDGWLDLFVGNYVQWTPETDLFCSTDGTNKGYCTPGIYEGAPARFYRNTGAGTFVDRTYEVGFDASPGQTLGAAALDYNADGWPDLVVANDLQPDELYENTGEGIFVEKGIVSGIAFDERGQARAGMGIDVGPAGQDGALTVVVGNFGNQMMSVFQYQGNGLFLDRAAASQIGIPSLRTLTFGLFLFDADLDGDLDVFAANGHIQPDIVKVQDNSTYRQPSHLFLNDGAGQFVDAAPGLGGVLAEGLVGRGAAYGDYDRDGDLDLLVTENGGPAHLWRNDFAEPGSGRHFLRVHLAGRTSNRQGVGAEVSAVVDGRRMQRRVQTGASYLSTSEKAVTFGLGPATTVDSVIVVWPSGTVQRLGEIAADQEIRIEEGRGGFTVLPREAAEQREGETS